LRQSRVKVNNKIKLKTSQKLWQCGPKKKSRRKTQRKNPNKTNLDERKMDLVNFCAKYISSIWFGECGAHRNYLITLGHYVTEAPGQLPPDFGFNQRANQVKHNTKSAPNG